MRLHLLTNSPAQGCRKLVDGPASPQHRRPSSLASSTEGAGDGPQLPGCPAEGPASRASTAESPGGGPQLAQCSATGPLTSSWHRSRQPPLSNLLATRLSISWAPPSRSSQTSLSSCLSLLRPFLSLCLLSDQSSLVNRGARQDPAPPAFSTKRPCLLAARSRAGPAELRGVDLEPASCSPNGQSGLLLPRP